MKNTTLFLAALLVLYTISSCKKNSIETPEYLGVAICASDQFYYEEALKVNGSDHPANADFTANPYYSNITASLSEKVSWTVTITGQTSGAIKTYTGLSKEVNVNWHGNADADIFFQDGEACTISLQPSCREAVSLSMNIAHKSTFAHMGVLVYDCDNVLGGVTKAPSGSPGYNNPNIKHVDTLHADPSPQGGKCHIMYAPQGTSGWYFGAYVQSNGFPASMESFAAGLSTDEIYVNLYLKGEPGTIASVVVYEKVGEDKIPFKQNFTIGWSGWRMVSFKLSDVNVGDPTQVAEFDFIASPTAYNAETTAYVDFMIVTKGKPFAGAN